ncbi:MAG: hypothetical protein LQ342_000183 [Letrouitia transgressa]|nr:MAG: hypothetical protein LQ342_000183 [Letrouitia transgressa]
MSESQAFSILSVLCDRLLPGYYSTTMYGTLLDQRVFESLVEKTMPILWDHLVKSDVQLSVVSLPWFLSLYINSMPLVFAFRVLDVFFLEGPKVLFQVGLAILRMNGEELLDVADDGTFISILKTYFSRLDESAHPTSENEKYRSVTRFQELMVVAFKEFSGITQNTISEQRAKHKDAVLDNIESFAKRTSIRNLGPDSKRLSLDDLGFLYDRFYGLLYEQEQRIHSMREESETRAKAGKVKATEIVTGIAGNAGVEVGRVGLGPSPASMNYDAFRELLAEITRWAIADTPLSPGKGPMHEKDNGALSNNNRKRTVSPGRNKHAEPADHDFMQRLYRSWSKDDKDGLSLQNVVSGLAQVKGTTDIMSSISYFFELYDDDRDGKVDREGILRVSEALLFLSRRGLDGLTPSPLSNGLDHNSDPDDRGTSTNERFLSSVSSFIRRCFEYADPDHLQNQNEPTDSTEPQLETGVDSIALGNDGDEEDLLDLSGDKPPNPNPPAGQPSLRFPTKSTQPSSPKPKSSPAMPRKPHQPPTHQSANLALDPANPLHITLPTFRMVILADELLQQFFESSFPASFYLSPTVQRTPTTGSNSALTTFASPHPLPVPSRAGTMVPPGNKGIRGVLDNIVSDGMRVAQEVRKRMDEAQREIEKNALAKPEEDEEDEEAVGRGGAYGGDPERRSVREQDRDLLEGAEAAVEPAPAAGLKVGQGDFAGLGADGAEGGGKAEGKVEFER